MRTRCRRFLLLLLMFALPVQAWAAASMLDCAFGKWPAGLGVAVAVMDHGAHTVQADSVVDHAGHAANPVDRSQGCHPAADPAPLSDGAHECQHCATCLLGATLPLPMTEMPLALTAAHRYPNLSDAAPAAFLLDGPDRPPRSPLV